MVWGIRLRARVITWVSSQSERFFTSGCSSAAFLPANACMMSARLLILLLAGICASVLSFSGGYSLMRISVSMMNLLVNMIQSYEIIWRDRKNALPLQHKRKVSGCSAVGSAHVWGARGRKFESCHPDSKKRSSNASLFAFYSPGFPVTWFRRHPHPSVMRSACTVPSPRKKAACSLKAEGSSVVRKRVVEPWVRRDSRAVCRWR